MDFNTYTKKKTSYKLKIKKCLELGRMLVSSFVHNMASISIFIRKMINIAGKRAKDRKKNYISIEASQMLFLTNQ